ncbi:MAG: DinB family protein [Gemmatimonadales bacterium]
MSVESTSDPFTRDEIRAGLEQLHDESVRYWLSFPTAHFFEKIGDAWSPSENVRHLTKSMRAVTKGLRLPRMFVRLAFKAATRPSRSYVEMRTVYRETLSRGGKAGKFGPGEAPAPVDTEGYRARIMSYHATAVSVLCSAVSKWSEKDLDRLQLPHPLMGPLTVREMLLFTLYHNSHHVEGVRKRLGNLNAKGNNE